MSAGRLLCASTTVYARCDVLSPIIERSINGRMASGCAAARSRAALRQDRGKAGEVISESSSGHGNDFMH